MSVLIVPGEKEGVIARRHHERITQTNGSVDPFLCKDNFRDASTCASHERGEGRDQEHVQVKVETTEREENLEPNDVGLMGESPKAISEYP
eukprot:scaffold300127_cov33-Tisochrysis_lutea.AAC.2